MISRTSSSSAGQRPRLSGVAFLAAAMMISACADSAETAATTSLTTDLPRVAGSDRLPYDDLRLSPKETDALQSAFNELVRQCATSFGVDLVLVSEDPNATDMHSRMWPGRFGTLPLAHARAYGYHAAPSGPSTKPFTIFIREDEQPQVEVLDGVAVAGGPGLRGDDGQPVPEGGCRGEVARQLKGDPRELGPVDAEDIRLEAFRDPRAKAAMVAWGDCMADKGYAFETIDQPVDAALGTPVSDEERTVAVADVLCTRESRWRDITFVIEASLQERSIERANGQLEWDLEAEKDLLQRAQRAVRRLK